MRLRAVEQDDENWYTDGPRYGREESPVGISRIGSGQPLWANTLWHSRSCADGMSPVRYVGCVASESQAGEAQRNEHDVLTTNRREVEEYMRTLGQGRDWSHIFLAGDHGSNLKGKRRGACCAAHCMTVCVVAAAIGQLALRVRVHFT